MNGVSMVEAFVPTQALCGAFGGSRVHAAVAQRPKYRGSVRRQHGVTAQFNYNIYQDGSERSKRGVASNERAVTIQKPLGLVLEEAQDGMVFVADVTEDGNAAKDGSIGVGDVVVACSATFGDEVWSTRGIGLERVMKSIAVRSGDFVTLVLETPDELARKKAEATAGAQARRVEARDKFGEREVLDPTSWVSTGSSTPQYDDQYAQDKVDIDSKLKEKLKQEVVAPYTQNWILWASVGVGFLVIASVLILGS
eukprot:Plantae.Rhodophyta-Rhodochaete_pulchella.ctg3188.p2 GENE.Plantae.Rhodophyta-Rhodochaete_pulchella.ctg3188~~Plantae.Rhodophyta-Rhodochaete_pulchella.ctg3188.p2  ORF type:complete len:253 (-),score=35.71 Plantae.Rhodophyta-Rhodochaete_pulchella.ctg3188:1175-1933(-)